MTDAERDLLDAVRDADIVSLATALIDAGGENPGDTEAATAKVLLDHAARSGFDIEIVEVAPGRPNVFLSVGPVADAGVLFVGHSDVVPAGGGWSTDPFSAVVRNGRLVGRGACDMKGGLAAVVAAMDASRRSGDRIPMTLACLVDEEDTGLGIRSFVSEPQARTYRACVVAEPTDLVTIVGCRGAANLEIEVVGRSAHAGRPANGRNAISAAARIVSFIESTRAELEAGAHPDLGAATWNVGTISGGTGTSMVADKCTITVDRRLLPHESAHDVARTLSRRIADAGVAGEGIDVTIGVDMEMPGFLTSANHPLVTSALGAVADAVGTRGYDVWTASCDGGFVAREMGTPTVVLGPGDIETQAHQPDESIDLRQLCDSARAYVLLATRIIALPAL